MDEKLTIWEPSGKKQKKRGLEMRRFFQQNSEIAYRFALAVCAVICLVSCMIVKHNTTVKLREQFRQELSAERIRTEQEVLARVKEEYGINAQNAEKALIEQQAKTVAKVLYAMRNNRDVGLHLACWAVFDRVDHARYADDVYAVCSADQAFMGWSDNNPVLDDLYKIALEETQRWHTGVRPLDSAYVYLYWSPSEIYLFDDNGHKYFESDWLKYMDTVA